MSLETGNFWVIAEDIQLVFGHLIVGWVAEMSSILTLHIINLVIEIKFKLLKN